MRNRQQELIAQLTAELTPVRAASPPLRVAGLWWLGSWLFVIIVTLLTGPLRPGALVQLVTHAQFAAESLVGLLAAALIAAWAFEDSIPGARRHGLLQVGLVAAALWLIAYVVGLEYPALEPSMAGKRAGCVLQTLLFAGPPMAAGVWLIHRNYFPLAPLRSAALIGLAGAMLPALFMQFACMYDPAHILRFHILPIPGVVVVAVMGAWVARRVFSRRRGPARGR
jgi:Negative regulator of sigma F